MYSAKAGTIRKLVRATGFDTYDTLKLLIHAGSTDQSAQTHETE